MKTKELVYASLCAVIIAICSWISIPTAVPFTLQTFGIYLAIAVLGGKLGTISLLIYLGLGAIGLPVFAGFKSGLVALMGPTGGYIIGFLATALIMWGFEKFFGKNKVSFIISAIIGLIACYALGTVWFMKVFSAANGPIGLAATLGICVVPFIIPDLIKLVAAYLIGSKIYRLISPQGLKS